MERMFLVILIVMVPSLGFAQDDPGWLSQGALYIGLIVLVFEWILANTKWIKANSTIDAILTMVKKLFKLK